MKYRKKYKNTGLKIFTIIIFIIVAIIIFIPIVNIYLAINKQSSYDRYKDSVVENGFKLTRQRNDYCNLSQMCFNNENSYLELDKEYNTINYYELVDGKEYKSRNTLLLFGKILGDEKLSEISEDIDLILNSAEASKKYSFSFDYLEYFIIVSIQKEDDGSIEYVHLYISDDNTNLSSVLPSFYTFDIDSNEKETTLQGIYSLIFDHGNEKIKQYKDYFIKNHTEFASNPDSVVATINIGKYRLSLYYEWYLNKELREISGRYSDDSYSVNDDWISIKYSREYFKKNCKTIIDKDILYFESKTNTQLDENYISENIIKQIGNTKLYDQSIIDNGTMKISINTDDESITINYYVKN